MPVYFSRFWPELVEFLHQCVIHGIEEFAKDPGRKLSKKLENFQDVLKWLDIRSYVGAQHLRRMHQIY